MSDVAKLESLVDHGRMAEAAQAARAILARNPDDAHVTALLAVALSGLEESREAVDTAQRAVQLAPEDPYASVVLGFTLQRAGRHREVLDQVGRTLRLDPQHIEAHVLFVDAASRLVDRRFGRSKQRLIEDADRHARTAVELDATHAGAKVARAKVHAMKEDWRSTRLWAERALADDPNHAVVRQLLGIAAQALGDLRGAGDHFVEAARLNPRSGTSMRLLKGVRRSAPVSGVVIYIGVQALIRGTRAIGGAAVAGLVIGLVVVGWLLWLFVLSPRMARRELSEDAQEALRRNRRLGG